MIKLTVNREAESVVIGMICQFEGAWQRFISLGLSEDHFATEIYRRTFGIGLELQAANEPVTFVTLGTRMPTQDTVKLIDKMGDPRLCGNPDYYFGELHDAYKLRLSAEHLVNLNKAVNSEDKDIVAHVTDAAQQLIDFDKPKQSIKKIAEISGDVLKEIENEIADSLTGKSNIIETGIIMLDDYLQIRPGNLIVLGARPGVGKTSLAVNIADYVAQKGKHALIFSFEMTQTEIYNKILPLHTGVPTINLLRGKISDDAKRSFGIGFNKARKLPIYIDCDPKTKFDELCNKARIQKNAGKLDFMIVDYLTLIKPSMSFNSIREMIVHYTGYLKALALELKVPILLLAQLSRHVEGRPNPMPMLSDLKESGSIEQDADAVIFLYRDVNDEKGDAAITIAKNRSGRLGTFKLRFDAPLGKFS